MNTMKSTELFNLLDRGFFALMVLIATLLGLMTLEIMAVNSVAHEHLHNLQIGFFFILLGLGLWVFYLKHQLKRASQAEASSLKDQLSVQASQLQVVNQQVSDIIDASPDLVWVKDLDGFYLSCNLPFARYIGFESAQIIGKTDFDLTTPEEAAGFRAHDRQTIAARKATVIEELHTPAQGSCPQLFEIIKTPVYDAHGQVSGVQGIGRDITQRRAAETALQEANEQRRLLELCIPKLNEMVVITEAQTIDLPGPRIVFVNDAFERMTGYSRGEAMGQSPRLLQGPKTDRSELDRVRKALLSGQPVQVELLNYKKNGEEFWSEIQIVPVADDTASITHWIAVERDVTQRKAAEAEMLFICDRALEASRLKSEFLSTISHEMRTPMNGVIGMAHVLQGTDLSELQQMYVGHIVSAAQDYMQVIGKALDFSKMDTGKLVIECRPFDLLAMIQGVKDATQPKADAKQLALQITRDANLPTTLLGDERRLRQCLMFLLDNAVKFTAKGSAALEVKAVCWDGDVPAVRFAVTDTGIGLSDSDRLRLFRPFVQGDGSPTRRYGGVGLGLVICQQLIELMQGRLGVQSTPGEGSTFWFEVSLRAAA